MLSVCHIKWLNVLVWNTTGRPSDSCETGQHRLLKKLHTSKLEEDLHYADLASKSWWQTLKCFINPCETSSIPQLQSGDDIVSDNYAKANLLNANLLNAFFRDQTLLDDSTSTLPVLADPLPHTP